MKRFLLFVFFLSSVTDTAYAFGNEYDAIASEGGKSMFYSSCKLVPSAMQYFVMHYFQKQQSERKIFSSLYSTVSLMLPATVTLAITSTIRSKIAKNKAKEKSAIDSIRAGTRSLFTCAQEIAPEMVRDRHLRRKATESSSPWDIENVCRLGAISKKVELSPTYIIANDIICCITDLIDECNFSYARDLKKAAQCVGQSFFKIALVNAAMDKPLHVKNISSAFAWAVFMSICKFGTEVLDFNKPTEIKTREEKTITTTETKSES